MTIPLYPLHWSFEYPEYWPICVWKQIPNWALVTDPIWPPMLPWYFQPSFKKRQLFHLSIQIGEWDMILFTKRCYIFFLFWHSIWPLNVYSCDWVFTQKFTEANWLFSMRDWEPSEALLLVLCRLWFSVFVSKNDFTMGKGKLCDMRRSLFRLS